MQTLKDSIKTIVISLSVLSLISVAYAWTEPTSNPPAGNVFAPITTGSTQIKSGGLGVGSLDVAGGAYFGGTLNVTGTTTLTGLSATNGTFSGNVGIAGDVKIGNQNATCSSENAGSVRYNTTSKKLEYCNGTSWKTVADAVAWLVNNLHNEDQCTSSGGTVVDDGAGNKMCKFNAASCPVGWTQYNNWSTTANKSVLYTNETCTGGYSYNGGGCGTNQISCSVNGHTWSSNASQETTSCNGTNKWYIVSAFSHLKI